METPEPAPPTYPPPPGGATPGRRWTIAAFVLAALALLLPILFAPCGLAAAILGLRKGDPLGKTAALVSVASMVVGALLTALLTAGGDQALRSTT